MNMTIKRGKWAMKFLREHRSFHRWRLDDDVYCVACQGCFKVVDMTVSPEGVVHCPICKSSYPEAFHTIPWWRRDLIDEFGFKLVLVHKWRTNPIRARLGAPQSLPAADPIPAGK